MSGITSYGTYVPRFRLDKAEIAAAVGEKGTGTRVVASFDQDSTTLGVEAARLALSRSVAGPSVGSVWFATTSPSYVDKTNATTIHAALDLPGDIGAWDLGASSRSAVAALMAAAGSDGLAVLADLRGGLPGGTDERSSGDAGTAFLFGTEGIIAQPLAHASATAEFLDRWANPGDPGSHSWEERFGEGEYAKVAERAVDDVLKSAGLTIADVDHVVVACPNARAAKSVAASLRKQAGASTAGKEISDLVGVSGVATLGLALADALDTAEADQVVLALGLADGADAVLLRTTAALLDQRGTPVRDQLEGGLPVAYPTYLMWRGLLDREPPRRQDPVRASAPFAARNLAYKFAFKGGRCGTCGTVQFPLPTVCLSCQARGGFEPVAGAESLGHIVTFTVDRLAFTPSPPLISAVVDLDVGGRVNVEVTDVPLDQLAVGLGVRMTFRRLMTADGVHNYHWKAGPQ